MTLIESKIDKKIKMKFAENKDSMIGMCSKCYSSGVSLVLEEELFETVCDKWNFAEIYFVSKHQNLQQVFARTVWFSVPVNCINCTSRLDG